MKSITLSLSIALAHLFAASAFAQQPTSAETHPSGTPPPAPYVKATSAEKADGKVQRKQVGSEAAKSSMPGEGTPVPEAKTKVPKDEKQVARATRKTESKRANNAGELTTRGEAGYAR